MAAVSLLNLLRPGAPDNMAGTANFRPMFCLSTGNDGLPPAGSSLVP